MPFFGVPIRNGLPIGLGSVAGFGVQQFDPSQLFEGGTVAGAWYDPSDLSTMFTTSVGTTQCAMPGQGSAVSVGLMLDKSQGLVLGSEALTNPGPGFTVTTGWTSGRAATLSIASGTLRVTNTVAYGQAYQAITTVVGTTYRVTVTVANAATLFDIFVGTTGPETGLIVQRSNNAAGTYTFYFTATTTTSWLTFGNSGASAGNTFDLVSATLKALPGNHAIAFNNTTARPELRARVNLLVATATLSTQSVTTQATSYTLRFAGTGSITLSGTATGSYSAGTHTITCTAGTLTLTVSGTVTTADLRPANSGALLPAYQAVVDANTYDTSGFPLYLRFDGIDDSMYTPANLNLSGTDKATVFLGLRKESDANIAVPLEFSNASGWTVSNGSFALYAPSYLSGSLPAPKYFVGLRGSGLRQEEFSTFTAPISNVLAESINIGAAAASEISMRINGAVVVPSATSGDAGTANFGNYSVSIGARTNGGTAFPGNIYSLIIAGSAVSAGNISATEQWVAGKVGLVIP